MRGVSLASIAERVKRLNKTVSYNQASLMTKVAHAGKDHRYIMLIGRLDDFVIAH